MGNDLLVGVEGEKGVYTTIKEPPSDDVLEDFDLDDFPDEDPFEIHLSDNEQSEADDGLPY